MDVIDSRPGACAYLFRQVEIESIVRQAENRWSSYRVTAVSNGRHAGAIETIRVPHLAEAQMVQLKNEPSGRSGIEWRAVAGGR
jgi:hypothetical protein